MAAINIIAVRGAVPVLHELAKRKNWAAKNPGVMVVFCIAFVVAVSVIGLMINKSLAKRKAAKSQDFQ